MKAEKANKVIAEYMGYELREMSWGICAGGAQLGKGKTAYSESLDLLIPVWEKMGRVSILAHFWDGRVINFVIQDHNNAGPDMSMVSSDNGTVQESACIATAKAIIELQKKT